MKIEQHPLSAAFPAMPEDEFARLAADIHKRGLEHPIVLYEGKVLDGWHRYLACVDGGIRPKYKAYKGKDPRGFVKSANLHRRHLKAGQTALILVAISQWLPVGKPSNSALGAELTSEDMAKEADVGTRTIEQAKKVHRNGSKRLNAAVTEGEISVKQAAALADLPKREQDEAIAELKDAPKPDHPATVAWEKFAALQTERDELAERCADLADLLKTCDAVQGTDAAIEMQKLRGELRNVKQRRDELMAQNHQMRKEIGAWQARAKKAGWKNDKSA